MENDAIFRVQQGDRDAFASIVEAHKEAVYRWCYCLTREPEEAQDLAQETFIQAFNKIHQYQPIGSFRAWLTRIAYRQFLSAMEKRRRRQAASSLIEEEVQFIAGLNQEREEAEDDGKFLRLLMDKLPEDYRLCLLMRYENGLSVAEIASAMELTGVNVKVRLFRAKALLAKAVKALERKPHEM